MNDVTGDRGSSHNTVFCFCRRLRNHKTPTTSRKTIITATTMPAIAPPLRPPPPPDLPTYGFPVDAAVAVAVIVMGTVVVNAMPFELKVNVSDMTLTCEANMVPVGDVGRTVVVKVTRFGPVVKMAVCVTAGMVATLFDDAANVPVDEVGSSSPDDAGPLVTEAYICWPFTNKPSSSSMTQIWPDVIVEPEVAPRGTICSA